jgi:hypothetical protein
MFALLLRYNALHERQYFSYNLLALRLQREMPGFDKLDHGIRKITLKCLRARRNEYRITFAPDGQQRNLRLAEILMDRRVGFHGVGGRRTNRVDVLGPRSPARSAENPAFSRMD